MKSGKARVKSSKTEGGTQEDSTQEVRVPIDKKQYEKLKALKQETGISIGDLVYGFIDWGLEVKADAYRKWAQEGPRRQRQVND